MLRILLTIWCLALAAQGEIVSKALDYKEGSTTLEGFHIYDNAKAGKRPTVLIVHQWKGLGDYERKRGQMLAELGYNVVGVDIYGKGVRPSAVPAASAEAGKYKEDRQLLRARVKAGLDAAKKLPQTDPAKIAAIGYCFGGTTVLELARSGADVAGVVSFHGGLSTSIPAKKGDIKGKVLVLHGADDPHVPVPEVNGFQKEMQESGADWQLVAYGNAVHSFTHWEAGTDNSKGAAYNEKADKRSWEDMKDFFAEIFPGK